MILAAGRGTRMRRREAGVRLTAEQRSAAELGWKALMPVAGRPFLDHLLGAVRDAGGRRVVLVAPSGEASLVGRYGDGWGGPDGAGLEIRCVAQRAARGTADALLACREAVGPGPFLLLNGDNFYPAAALAALAGLAGCGCLGLDVEAVLAGGRSNLDRRRILEWALLETRPDGSLVRIVEKPDPEEAARLGSPRLASPNAWRFDERIFRACEAIGPSPRGELELPAAVQHAIDRLGVRFEVVRTAAPILDLGRRRDVAAVEALLSRPEGTA